MIVRATRAVTARLHPPIEAQYLDSSYAARLRAELRAIGYGACPGEKDTLELLNQERGDGDASRLVGLRCRGDDFPTYSDSVLDIPARRLRW